MTLDVSHRGRGGLVRLDDLDAQMQQGGYTRLLFASNKDIGWKIQYIVDHMPYEELRLVSDREVLIPQGSADLDEVGVIDRYIVYGRRT